MNMGHARSLLKLSPEQQYHAACTFIKKQLNVRDTVTLANQLKFSRYEGGNKKFSSVTQHDKCLEWSTCLSQQFTTNVSVRLNAKGKVIIEVNLASEVDWLIKKMSEKVL
ncbi:TPA: hypothetical protein ACXYK5_002737 [Legionella pneumophila]